MNYANTKAKLLNTKLPPDGRAPLWSNDGPLRAIPGIGHFFADRLNGAAVPGGRIITPADLVRRINTWLSAMPAAERQQGLRRSVQAICQNRRASTCHDGYYIRDVNPGCFLSIFALLSILRPDLGVFRGANVALQQPPAIDALGSKTVNWRRFKTIDGTFPAAQCPCLQTQGKCLAKKSCLWVAPPLNAAEGAPLHSRSKQCVPRGPGPLGFEGIGPYTGQKGAVPENSIRRPGSKYVHVPASKRTWRVPGGAIRPLRALPARNWPNV
jgi:hypothetical protein